MSTIVPTITRYPWRRKVPRRRANVDGARPNQRKAGGPMSKVSDPEHHPRCPHAACHKAKPDCDCCCICETIQGAMRGERFYWARQIGARMLQQKP